MTAEERGMEMMMIKMNQLPTRAYNYAKFLCNTYGMCGEVLLTAWTHYAQAVEGLPCTQNLYIIDEQGKKWFEENK